MKRSLTSRHWLLVTSGCLTSILFCPACDSAPPSSSVASSPTSPTSSQVSSELERPQTQPGELVQDNSSPGSPATTTSSTQERESKSTDSEPSPSLLGRASELLGQAKDGTSNAGRWVQDQLGAAADSTGSAAQGTVDWANDTFQYLKEQGMTSASSTSEWLANDWNNMESWEYKIVPIRELNNEELEQTLNERGKEGWECFSINDTRMILKRQKESYLRRLPFRDLIKLAPLLNQGGER